MKIIRLKNKQKQILAAAAKEIRAGATVVYPTDTAYGIGCDATNGKAVARIFKIKSRLAHKGLPVIVADHKMAAKYFFLSSSRTRGSRNVDSRFHGNDKLMFNLTNKFWPGPLSLVLAAKGKIAPAVLEKKTAAVRVPDSALARLLAKFVGRPLVATSANLSGEPACYSARAFVKQIAGEKNRPDLVLDAGRLRKRKPSTIARVLKNGTVKILRAGPVRHKIR